MKLALKCVPLCLLTVLLLAAGNSAAGETKAALGSVALEGTPATRSGDYVVYRDYTWEKATWIGFLYYDDSTYGAFLVTPESGSKVSLLFRVETVEGQMILTGQNIISKITQDDVMAVNYLMTLLPDMYAWRLSAGTVKTDRPPLLPPLVSKVLVKPEFGGEVVLNYASEVPVFNMQDMVSSAGKPVLSLARMGHIQAGEEESFFGFVPVPELKEGAALSVPSSRKSEVKTVDGVKVNLDDQWTMVADNTFFLGDAAALIVDTIDLTEQKIDQKNLPVSLVRLFSLSSKSSWALPPSLSVTGTAKKIRIANTFYDMTTGAANRDIKLCMPLAKGKCTIISLSVSETAYRANKAYFDSLF